MCASKCILLVDDEEDLTWSISKSLNKNDKIFEVVCVNNGNSALEVLSARHVDLVISDLRMPGRDGLALLLDIQSSYPDTRVIIMTAHGTEQMRQAVKQLGTPYYIEKPFEIRYLRKLIYEALDLNQTGLEGMLVNSRIRDPQGISNERTIQTGWQTLLNLKMAD